MKVDLMNLEVDVLNRLYKAKEQELEYAILSGTSWDEVSLQRKTLLELSSALHTKLLRQGLHAPRFPTQPDSEALTPGKKYFRNIRSKQHLNHCLL